MLREADRGIRREREARHCEAIDLFLLEIRRLEKLGKGARQPPVRGADGIADIGNGDGRCEHHAVVRLPHRCRFLPSRRSKRRAGSNWKSASLTFCTLLVEVVGSSSTKATCPGA